MYSRGAPISESVSIKGFTTKVCMNLDNFLTHIFSKICVAGPLNHSEVRFQEDMVLVRGFTGFVQKKGQFMEKNMWFQKHQNLLGCDLKQDGH